MAPRLRMTVTIPTLPPETREIARTAISARADNATRKTLGVPLSALIGGREAIGLDVVAAAWWVAGGMRENLDSLLDLPGGVWTGAEVELVDDDPEDSDPEA